MEVNLIFESLKFMVLGMATVFIFLALMIYILKLQAFIIQKFFTNKESSKDLSLDVKNVNNDEAEIIAVITAAITDFKKNSKGN